MTKILNKNFYEQSTEKVARGLLGAYLLRQKDGTIEKFRITETEAYLGEADKACHANKGRTRRTEVMYGPAGYWYVYLIYGMYNMLNIVTREEGEPEAVLIRGVEGFNGPGKLTKALSIDRTLNALAADPGTGLWIETGDMVEENKVLVTPRIGIEYAQEWCEKPLRYVLQ